MKGSAAIRHPKQGLNHSTKRPPIRAFLWLHLPCGCSQFNPQIGIGGSSSLLPVKNSATPFSAPTPMCWIWKWCSELSRHSACLRPMSACLFPAPAILCLLNVPGRQQELAQVPCFPATHVGDLDGCFKLLAISGMWEASHSIQDLALQ